MLILPFSAGNKGYRHVYLYRVTQIDMLNLCQVLLIAFSPTVSE